MEIEIMYIEYQWKRFMSNKTIKITFIGKQTLTFTITFIIMHS